jgi:hypothetical protein
MPALPIVEASIFRRCDQGRRSRTVHLHAGMKALAVRSRANSLPPSDIKAKHKFT